jgi:hypothetical protein
METSDNSDQQSDLGGKIYDTQLKNDQHALEI